MADDGRDIGHVREEEKWVRVLVGKPA